MNEKYLNLFSVPIQMTKLELNIDSLIEFCYEMKRKNEEGIEKSNIGGWQSSNVIDETYTEFVKLKTEIENAANVYHEEMEFKKTMKQKIVNIWININQKGNSNEFHVHPFSCLSGAFYLTKSKIPIIFRHSNHDIANYYWRKSIIEKWNVVTANEWWFDPEPNVLFVFPAWVEHKVSMNKEDTDRISISFNTEIYKIEKGNG